MADLSSRTLTGENRINPICLNLLQSHLLTMLGKLCVNRRTLLAQNAGPSCQTPSLALGTRFVLHLAVQADHFCSRPTPKLISKAPIEPSNS
jgi:hypothetical protein